VLQLAGPAVHFVLKQPFDRAGPDATKEVGFRVTIIKEVSSLLQPLCLEGGLVPPHMCWGHSRDASTYV
jgi:hypothetical protein